MKKIIAFLSKGSKIHRILVYIYRGLVVSSAAFEAGLAALKVEKPEDKAYAKLEGIPEYLAGAAKAIKQILTWMGDDTDAIEREVLAKRDSSANLTGVENQALFTIVDHLNDENI